MRRTFSFISQQTAASSVQTCPLPALPVMLGNFFKYFSVVGGEAGGNVNFPDSFSRQGEVGATGQVDTWRLHLRGGEARGWCFLWFHSANSVKLWAGAVGPHGGQRSLAADRLLSQILASVPFFCSRWGPVSPQGQPSCLEASLSSVTSPLSPSLGS